LSEVYGTNDAGLVVGESSGSTVPESSTWAMMLFGFTGLALVGYRRAKAEPEALTRQVA
jgi:hypothetical protein